MLQPAACCCCPSLVTPAVMMDDGQLQHVNLEQVQHKVVDRPPRPIPSRKSTTPTPPPVPAPGSKASKAEPGSARAGPRSSDPQLPAGSDGGSEGAGPSRSARPGSADGGGDGGPKADAPVRRSQRTAAAAAKEPPKPVEVQPREATPVAAAPAGGGSGGRQAPLNMSNVGRKDREAARALLGFTNMAAGVSARHWAVEHTSTRGPLAQHTAVEASSPRSTSPALTPLVPVTLAPRACTHSG